MKNLRLLYLLGILVGLILVNRYNKHKERFRQQKLLRNKRVKIGDKRELTTLDKYEKKELISSETIEKTINTNEILAETSKKEDPVKDEKCIEKQSYTPRNFKRIPYALEVIETEEEVHSLGIIDSKSIEIINIIKSKNIHELLHFTNMENLYSIINNGFLSVELQRGMGIRARINDKDRFDNKLNATSFSIGFPNYKMFYSLRNKDKHSKWIIITINPNILYLHKGNIYYCENNGASREMRLKSNDYLKGINAFQNMFREEMNTRYYGKINRSDLNIPTIYTTDPQAEILIEGYIPSKFIRSIYLEDYDSFYLVENIIGDKMFDYNIDIMSNYFSARRDYEFWKRRY